MSIEFQKCKEIIADYISTHTPDLAIYTLKYLFEREDFIKKENFNLKNELFEKFNNNEPIKLIFGNELLLDISLEEVYEGRFKIKFKIKRKEIDQETLWLYLEQKVERFLENLKLIIYVLNQT